MHRKLLEKLMQELEPEPLDMTCPVMRAWLKAVLEEDVQSGDFTSELVLPENPVVEAFFVSRHAAVVAGLPVAEEFFRIVDKSIVFTSCVREGGWAQKGQKIAELRGPIKSLLKAERVALNIFQHLCGIATAVHRCVLVAQKYNVRIADTRKTMPLMRRLQKYAVTVGGGKNHRFDLSHGILIKDNHINAINSRNRPAAVKKAVERAKQQAEFLVEIEVESFAEAKAAVEAGADIIMLDNMTPARMRKAVDMIAGRALIEASGGITLKSLEKVAKSGINFISLGRLTHSVQAADIALEIVL